MEETVHIAFCFDQNYAMPAGVAMLSICINTPGPVCFHALVSSDVTDVTVKQMENMVAPYGDSVVFHYVDQALVDGTHTNGYLSQSTYYRLLLPVILPSELSRVIYLDCDVVTVASLRPLWETELGENDPSAMVHDSGGSDVRYHNELGIPLVHPYYNSGVILMNLDCWRKENLSQKCISSAVENDYRFVDQDAQNLVLGTRIKPLSFRYNLQQNLLTDDESQWLLEKGKFFDDVHESMKNPVVIHFIGWIKPWHEGCKNAEEWLKCKSLSPWKDDPLRPRPYKESYQLTIENIYDGEGEIAESFAQPLISIGMNLARKHHRIFVLFRKALWTIAKKKRLV